MLFNTIYSYDEMEENGLTVVEVFTNSNIKVCSVEYTDLMGGYERINGDINLSALTILLVELRDLISTNEPNHYGNIDIDINCDIVTFTNDTEPFAELQGKQAFVLDKDELALSLVILSTYFVD